MSEDRDNADSPESARGTAERASDGVVWKNPPGASRRTPGSHSTGGGKDHAVPGENEGA